MSVSRCGSESPGAVPTPDRGRPMTASCRRSRRRERRPRCRPRTTRDGIRARRPSAGSQRGGVPARSSAAQPRSRRSPAAERRGVRRQPRGFRARLADSRCRGHRTARARRQHPSAHGAAHIEGSLRTSRVAKHERSRRVRQLREASVRSDARLPMRRLEWLPSHGRGVPAEERALRRRSGLLQAPHGRRR